MVSGLPAGLSTVGYQVFSPDGTPWASSSWSQANVAERPSGSGTYGAFPILVPLVCEVRWSVNNVAPFYAQVFNPVSVAASGLDAVMTEGTINARQALALCLDALASVISGATGASGTIMIKDPTAAHNRIVAAVDQYGNRMEITLTPPP
jgi:hypothetical protein